MGGVAAAGGPAARRVRRRDRRGGRRTGPAPARLGLRHLGPLRRRPPRRSGGLGWGGRRPGAVRRGAPRPHGGLARGPRRLGGRPPDRGCRCRPAGAGRVPGHAAGGRGRRGAPPAPAASSATTSAAGGDAASALGLADPAWLAGARRRGRLRPRALPPPPVGAGPPGLRGHGLGARRDDGGDGGAGRPVLRRRPVAPGDGPRPRGCSPPWSPRPRVSPPGGRSLRSWCRTSAR